MKLILTMILVTASLCLSGCSDGLFEEKIPAENAVTRVSSFVQREVVIDYIPREDANRYDIRLSWPAFEGFVRIRNSNGEILNESTSDKSEFTIENTEGGVQTDYSMESFNPQRGLNKDFKFSAKPPKDLVYSGNIVLGSNVTEANNRIFLTDNTTIETQSFNFNLTFAELFIGKNVKIISFSENAKALPSTSGRSAGAVNLSGSYAKGSLFISMSAEAGGDGATGVVSCIQGYIKDKCEGSSGGDGGLLGIANIEVDDSSEFTISSSITRPLGGNPGGKYSGDLNGVCSAQPSNMLELPNCLVPPKSGNSSTGGSICTRLGKDAAYVCKN